MTGASTFRQDAMRTTFTLLIRDEDPRQAAGVARECFQHLEYLESRLSRYLEGSDVWRINTLRAGESLFLSEACHDCLRLAAEANRLTGGLFDSTLGRQVEYAKNPQGGPCPPAAGRLVIDPARPLIRCEEEGREIDLGGIGKGFALDQMAALLRDWGIRSALLSAGASTHLAFGAHRWPVGLRGDSDQRTLELHNQALSASGTGIQGGHIVLSDGEPRHYAFRRAWAVCETAALADAWSTALMLSNPAEIRTLNARPATCFVETATGISPPERLPV